jgi:5-methyltetrahydropteroyltriglutamate--homocysteine methyltransferase
MATLVDDVGSFPLPANADTKMFEEAYRTARKASAEGKRLEKDEFLLNNFKRIVIDSFMKKAETGLDVVNYPQHYDMHRQVADILRESMNEGAYLIAQERAVLPEVRVINEEAKRISEETGGKVKLRVCIIGPIELYLKEIGSVVHRDILQMFAEDVRRFAENSILNSKYIQTVAVSLDEPSFGFQDLSTDRETVLSAVETAFNFGGATRQIHLHSPTKITDLLNVTNIDVLSIEYAASPKNIDSVSKGMLDKADKQIRVGVSRTDIDSIIAELYDNGITKPNAEQMVEDERIIRKRFETAKAKYGDRMTFTGPDCGLGGWSTQESAQLLLTRTVKAVRAAGNEPQI